MQVFHPPLCVVVGKAGVFCRDGFFVDLIIADRIPPMRISGAVN
jgi:hypothetical protein